MGGILVNIPNLWIENEKFKPLITTSPSPKFFKYIYPKTR